MPKQRTSPQSSASSSMTGKMPSAPTPDLHSDHWHFSGPFRLRLPFVARISESCNAESRYTAAFSLTAFPAKLAPFPGAIDKQSSVLRRRKGRSLVCSGHSSRAGWERCLTGGLVVDASSSTVPAMW